jgi:amidophosphoribosyltransferase
MEKIGHFLDVEVDEVHEQYSKEGYDSKHLNEIVAQKISVENILKKSSWNFDGGYAFAGMIGHGDAFVLRDPNGIRPAFWYEDDEIVVVTSERPAIQTAFNVDIDKIQAVKPGHALIIRKDGTVSQPQILPARELKQCSFERIYFSRGTDKDIYKERKMLGRLVAPAILKAIDYDIKNTVFSYIPNTAEVAYLGMMEAVDDYLNDYKKEQLRKGDLSTAKLDELLALKARSEKIAVKDAKLRTFITSDENRTELVSHVYDTTYGIVNPGVDNLVIIDDSIVRGTTLRNSIIRILDRLKPKKIIIVSSAPQIRFPDCYGIDMSKLKDFIAFKAAIELHKDNKNEALLQEVYAQCKANADNPDAPNFAKAIYDAFTPEQISDKIAEMLTTEHINAKIEIIFQTVEGLHQACPEHSGDWYFTGNFPTAGGNRVANRSFINFIEDNNERAY